MAQNGLPAARAALRDTRPAIVIFFLRPVDIDGSLLAVSGRGLFIEFAAGEERGGMFGRVFNT